MAVRAPGDYDPNTGWPPDDSTGVRWQDDVTLPGQFQGGGAGFGPGGFQGNPKLTSPASGPPPGISLSANPAGGAPATGGPDIFPPVNSTIPPNKSVGPFTGGTATDAIIRGVGNVARKFSPLRRIPFADLVTPSDELAPPSMDEAPTWSYPGGAGAPRPMPRPWGEPSPSNAPDSPPIGPADSPPIGPADGPVIAEPRRGPIPVDLPMPGGFQQPAHPSTMRYPMWPTPPAPAPFTGDPRNEPNNFPNSPNAIGVPVPTPIGSPAPAIPPRRATPRAAGPAAVRQQPNLGAYGGPFTTIDRPNMTPQNSAIGRPQMTALDLSRLFSRQQ